MNKLEFIKKEECLPEQQTYADGTPQRFHPVWAKIRGEETPHVIIAKTYYDHDRKEFCAMYNVEKKLEENYIHSGEVIEWSEAK